MLDPSPLTRRCGACGYRYESKIDACPIDRRALPPADATTADLGSYRLLERLGEGGMGAVYRAVHRKLGRAVAIKVLQKDLTSDRGMINRFFHEARAANTIRHEHVIEVYDFVEDGENVYFVMELLRGRDLHDTLHRSGCRERARWRPGARCACSSRWPPACTRRTCAASSTATSSRRTSFSATATASTTS